MKDTRLNTELKELEGLKKILNEKLNKLADLELTYSTLQTRLALFESEYYHRILSKYVEIDKLQAEIDKFYFAQKQYDNELKEKAFQSEEKANNSAKESEKYASFGVLYNQKFQPTPQLKNLYRELVKLLHPDLTKDEKEKERRHKIMLQVNEAYANGDIEMLEQIFYNVKNNIDTFDNNVSKIQQLKNQISSIDKKIIELKNSLNEIRNSDLYKIYIKVEDNLKNGVDILSKMEYSLKERIEFLTQQKNGLKEKH